MKIYLDCALVLGVTRSLNPGCCATCHDLVGNGAHAELYEGELLEVPGSELSAGGPREAMTMMYRVCCNVATACGLGPSALELEKGPSFRIPPAVAQIHHRRKESTECGPSYDAKVVRRYLINMKDSNHKTVALLHLGFLEDYVAEVEIRKRVKINKRRAEDSKPEHEKECEKIFYSVISKKKGEEDV